MAQAIARNHHQVLQRISHHHLHISIKMKKSDKCSKKELNSVSLEKSDCPISQTGVSDFDKTENVLAEKDDCSISSSDIEDDDDTDDEYGEQEILVEFEISSECPNKFPMSMFIILIICVALHQVSHVSFVTSHPNVPTREMTK
jgi:hypothetical protein